ncbi:unnamed protein product [Leuciscus chuanchicus]
MFHIHLGEKWVFSRFSGLILLPVAFVLLIQTPLCLKCFWRDLALSLYDSSIHENLQSAQGQDGFVNAWWPVEMLLSGLTQMTVVSGHAQFSSLIGEQQSLSAFPLLTDKPTPALSPLLTKLFSFTQAHVDVLCGLELSFSPFSIINFYQSSWPGPQWAKFGHWCSSLSPCNKDVNSPDVLIQRAFSTSGSSQWLIPSSSLHKQKALDQLELDGSYRPEASSCCGEENNAVCVAGTRNNTTLNN